MQSQPYFFCTCCLLTSHPKTGSRIYAFMVRIKRAREFQKSCGNVKVEKYAPYNDSFIEKLYTWKVMLRTFELKFWTRETVMISWMHSTQQMQVVIIFDGLARFSHILIKENQLWFNWGTRKIFWWGWGVVFSTYAFVFVLKLCAEKEIIPGFNKTGELTIITGYQKCRTHSCTCISSIICLKRALVDWRGILF